MVKVTREQLRHMWYPTCGPRREGTDSVGQRNWENMYNRHLENLQAIYYRETYKVDILNFFIYSGMIAQWDSSLSVLPVARVQFPATAEYFKGFFPG